MLFRRTGNGANTETQPDEWDYGSMLEKRKWLSKNAVVLLSKAGGKVLNSCYDWKENGVMDDRFRLFHQWYHSQLSTWERQGICLKNVNYCDNVQCHHMILTLSTESGNGICEIGLYESNQMYWVDVVSGNAFAKQMLYCSNIPFDNATFIQETVLQAMQYLCQR